MRTMYDGITAGNLPANATMVAGYISGRYAWSAANWNRFPNSIHVRIATAASVNDGTVLDVESGDATPIDSVNWVLSRRAAGIHPTVYCSLSAWQSVRDVFANRGVAEPEYWIAHYDGLTNIPNGAVAKQYQNTPGYDVSAVADYWPGIDGGPVTHPTENPNGILDNNDVGLIMAFGNVKDGTINQFVSLGSVLRADPIALLRALNVEVNNLMVQVQALQTTLGAAGGDANALTALTALVKGAIHDEIAAIRLTDTP